MPFGDSFEADLGQWVTDGAALAPGSGPDGSQALSVASGGTEAQPGTASYVQRALGAGETDLYVSFKTRPISVDANGVRIATLTGDDGSAIASIYVLADGTLGLRWTDTSELVVLGSIAVDQWSNIEMRIQLSVGTATATVWINGVFAATSTQTVYPVELSSLILGSWSTNRSFDLLIDDVRVDRTCNGSCPPPPVIEPTVVPTVGEPDPLLADPGTPEST